MGLFHPWRRLRHQPDIDLTWSPHLPEMGHTDGQTRIVMHPSQSQVERRCTLAHELAHIELGHTHGHDPRDEEQAARMAARWLVEFEALISALAWTENLAEAADELWVDTPTLLARLRGLSEIERAASAIPDAKDRLSYIATLTENAAERVLNATDRAQPHQTRLESGAAALAKHLRD